MAVQTLSAVRAQRKFLPQSGGQWLILVVLTVALLAYAMPVYVMVVTGLKSAQAASLATMWQLPTALTSGGFQEAWKRLSPNMLNSLEMVISATLLSSLLGSVNGYLFRSGSSAARTSYSRSWYSGCSFRIRASSSR